MTPTTTERRLVITISGGGFLAETAYKNGLGYWNTLNRTLTDTFPLYLVERVAARDDFRIYIRTA